MAKCCGEEGRICHADGGRMTHHGCRTNSTRVLAQLKFVSKDNGNAIDISTIKYAAENMFQMLHGV